MLQEITPQELKDRLEKKEEVYIIDVRETWEYEEQNIGVNNIPLNDIPHRLELLSEKKHTEVIVHCQTGRRSVQAQKYLIKQGFTNVKSLKGGIDAYLTQPK